MALPPQLQQIYSETSSPPVMTMTCLPSSMVPAPRRHHRTRSAVAPRSLRTHSLAQSLTRSPRPRQILSRVRALAIAAQPAASTTFSGNQARSPPIHLPPWASISPPLQAAKAATRSPRSIRLLLRVAILAAGTMIRYSASHRLQQLLRATRSRRAARRRLPRNQMQRTHSTSTV